MAHVRDSDVMATRSLAAAPAKRTAPKREKGVEMRSNVTLGTSLASCDIFGGHPDMIPRSPRSLVGRLAPAVLAILVSTLGCGDMAADTSSRGASEAPSPSNGNSKGDGDLGAGDDGASEPPAEREVESDYEAPVATGHFVWIANPKSGRVAFVDATTLEVRTVDAGNAPTYLAGVPGQTDDTTIVLNVLSSDATLLRATKQGIVTRRFPVAQGANSFSIASDGSFAVAWADARKVPNAPATQGFQDLTVLDLVKGTSTILSVGYRPVAVGFSTGNTRAYAVTQDGIAIVDLAATPVVTKNVAVADSPAEDPGSRDVSVTPDGSLAFIRRDGQSTITAVSLADGARHAITLSGPVTDLDLDAKGERAVAVVRSTSEAVILPVPGVVADPDTKTTVEVTGETIGSVVLSPEGSTGLLYTNAVASPRLTVLGLTATPPTTRTVRLYAPVLAVFSAPDAKHAVVLHDATAATNGSSATNGAFSLVPIAASLPAKIVATNAKPTAVAVANDHAVVAERDDASRTYGAYVATMPQLMVERLALASPPTAVGIVEGSKRAYIAQDHPEGRLTFVDLDTGVARTLTGFELSSRVVDGSTP